jgi:hypothetical protein
LLHLRCARHVRRARSIKHVTGKEPSQRPLLLLKRLENPDNVSASVANEDSAFAMDTLLNQHAYHSANTACAYICRCAFL